MSGGATALQRAGDAIPGASGVGSDADLYRQVCSEIDRLLAAGRLTEARRLNDQARALFRRLYGSSSGRGQLGAR